MRLDEKDPTEKGGEHDDPEKREQLMKEDPERDKMN